MGNGESQYIIYLDVYFAMNYWMDYLVIRCAGAVCRHLGMNDSKTYNWSREYISGMLAAVIGACFSVVFLVLPFRMHMGKLSEGLLRNSCMILCACLMTKVGMHTQNRRDMIQKVCIVYLTTFLMSGIVNQIYYSQMLSAYRGSITLFLVITWICDLGTRCGIWFISECIVHRQWEYEIAISIEGRRVVGRGFLDTGNVLMEPGSGKMVHIVEYWWYTGGDEKKLSNMFPIPYEAVGVEHGYLWGLEGDYLQIYKNKRIVLQIEKPVFAMYKGHLSADGRYHVLLNSALQSDL